MANDQSVPVAVLRDHYLRAIECDHSFHDDLGFTRVGRDKPHCSCSTVDLGWHASVGLAVEAWIAHVAAVAEAQRHG